MSVQDRNKQSYLVAVGLVLLGLVVFATIYVAILKTLPKESGATFGRKTDGTQELVVLNRDGSFEQMDRKGDNGPISVQRGTWNSASTEPNIRLMLQKENPDNYIALKGQGMVLTLSQKSMFHPVNEPMQQRIEEWRQAVAVQEKNASS